MLVSSILILFLIELRLINARVKVAICNCISKAMTQIFQKGLIDKQKKSGTNY